MIEQLSKDSHGFKLPMIIGAVLYNDVLDNLIVFYSVSEGEYKNVTIESESIWEYIVDKGYNLDFSYYVNGEEYSFGYDAQGFNQYMRFWQPDINKIVSQYFNNYLPNL
jgi:hypothetical protein